MKGSLFLLLAIVAVASAARFPDEVNRKILAHLFDLSAVQPEPEDSSFIAENEVEDDLETLNSQWEDLSEVQDPEAQGLIMNSQAKKIVKNILATMPCGWPQYGIPPLAPYRKEEMVFDIKKSVVESLTKLIHFQLEGLDDMKINKLKVSYTFSKKVTYSFTFPKIRVTGRYATDTFINLMEELGLSIRYEGDDSFEVILENLNVAGSFKYTMPILFGSIKIKKFKITMTLGNCIVNLNGIMGHGKANRLFNEEIEDTVMWAINGNQATISNKIEQTIVPTINARLKGRKVWYVLGNLGNLPSGNCVPPTDLWA